MITEANIKAAKRNNPLLALSVEDVKLKEEPSGVLPCFQLTVQHGSLWIRILAVSNLKATHKTELYRAIPGP